MQVGDLVRWLHKTGIITEIKQSSALTAKIWWTNGSYTWMDTADPYLEVA